ncbi:MAG: hypothetical protein ACE5J0_01885 [Candidatus Paceibacterales bacterium]
MAKKIFDILPPEKLEKKEKLPKKERFEYKISPPKIQLKKALIFIPLILIFAIAFSFKISKVEIKIWPETETVAFKTELTVDEKIENSDFKNGVIPGEIFEEKKTVSDEFSSSGKALKKAEGVIRLYNAYTTNFEVWLAGTRFVSTDGKLFKSKDKIRVPGAGIKNGKIDPSYVDVPVIAAQGGADYNIDPSHFSIVAYRGTPRYTKFYGESFEPMTGGGQALQATKEDLERAEDMLTEKAKIEVLAALESKIPAEFVFLKDASETEILEKSSLAQPGAEIKKFNFQVRVKSTTIAFKKEETENFAEQFILSQIPEGKLLYRESLKINYSPEIVNFELGRLSLSLDFSAKIYPEIDLQSLEKGLIGRSLAETKIFLENQPQIIRTEVRFWPFWVKSVPKDLEKIEIKYPLVDASI